MAYAFRINVGPETLLGRLPPVRVGKGYCSLFYITGVPFAEELPHPRLYVGADELTAQYWVAEWDGEKGFWVVDVGAEAAKDIANLFYTLVVHSTEGRQYVVGTGTFQVYSHIAIGGGETGATGESAGEILTDLLVRVGVLESRSGKIPTLVNPELFLPLYVVENEGVKQLTFGDE